MTYIPHSFGMSNIGNTSGTSGTVNADLVLAGGNNVTLSQSISGGAASVTISAANQTVQTQNLHNVTLSGNTAGAMAHISSGTLTLAGGNNITLSQNGNAVTISGAAGGGAAFSAGMSALGNTSGDTGLATNRLVMLGHNNITLSQVTNATGNILGVSGPNMFAAGMSNIGNTSGTSGTASNQVVFAGGDNITLSQATGVNGNTITISAGAGGGAAHTMNYYQNMDRGTSASLATANGTLMLQRLNQENDLFAGNLTANTLLLNMTANMTATSLSSSHSVSVSIGLYSNYSTRIELINSASTSWAVGAATSNTARYHGPRWLSLVNSQWSSAPNFTQDGDYVFGVMFRSSNYAPPMSYIGQNYMHSLQRSGTIGTTVATNTSMAQGNYWNAMYSASTAAFPGTISSNQVNRNNATAIFMPHVILNNRYSGTF